jgi:hypothetical protein
MRNHMITSRSAPPTRHRTKLLISGRIVNLASSLGAWQLRSQVTAWPALLVS